jgi:hypothetical protein
MKFGSNNKNNKNNKIIKLNYRWVGKPPRKDKHITEEILPQDDCLGMMQLKINRYL